MRPSSRACEDTGAGRAMLRLTLRGVKRKGVVALLWDRQRWRIPPCSVSCPHRRDLGHFAVGVLPEGAHRALLLL